MSWPWKREKPTHGLKYMQQPRSGECGITAAPSPWPFPYNGCDFPPFRVSTPVACAPNNTYRVWLDDKLGLYLPLLPR